MLIIPLSTQIDAQGASEVQVSVAVKPASSVTASPTPVPKLSHQEMADLLMVRREYQAALAEYLQVEPRTAKTWNQIGIAQQQLLLEQDARKSYERAIKLDPHNADALNNLGSIYYSLKDYRHAEHMYRKALKLRPDSALIYKNLGTDMLAKHDFSKGWVCYQQALSLDPEVFERMHVLRVGDPTPAMQRGAMNFYLAKSYAKVGMNDRAVEYLRMAIDEGFADRRKILSDKEFATLHNFEGFRELLSEQKMRQ
ncbi:tetratricopeptide repeat protein [Acidicapsa dinghuensis]|uniref:Tetratricopeptide repeat protein n=1 Tax=Acidicapsa dinghuensis TaxID=2218256 RepID=A0ABW1EKD5_9BACT|nr:tetratricopeptide repeat protein [Acidicapsa dinghuensis]